MTREEAIDMLYGMKADNLNLDDAYTKDKYDALEMAIQALEQEPSGETVSLEAFKQVKWERDIAIEQLKELGYGFGQKIESSGDLISKQSVLNACEQSINILEAVDRIMDLPSVKPQVSCGDAVSRQAALDAMYELCNTGETLEENPWRDNPHIDAITDAINNLQPIKPQDCDICEVGSPCLYCKHEFEPQERSDKE